MYAKCTFNYFYCIMDHCLLFCYCILVVYIYAHIVLYLSSRIVFLVLIELTKYKLSRAATLSHCSPTRYYRGMQHQLNFCTRFQIPGFLTKIPVSKLRFQSVMCRYPVFVHALVKNHFC